MSDEAAKQIDREDLVLRVAEAPQLAQGLASDAKIIGLVLPLPLPEASLESAEGAGAAASPLLGALAQELSWQSAMAELLALVRLEGLAASETPLPAAGAVNALELLLASAPGELAPEAPFPLPGKDGNGLKPAAAEFVDTDFGAVEASMLSLQDKDLFGLQGEGRSLRTAGIGREGDGALDIDLFGAGSSEALITISKANPPDPGTNVPIGEPGLGSGPGSASILNPAGTEPLQTRSNGYMALTEGAQTVKLDLMNALANADEANNLTVQGDGDDKLMLVGDWILVSEDPVKSVSVYAHADQPVSVVADNVEVVFA